MPDILAQVKYIHIDQIIPYHNNPKTHPQEQIDKLKSSIKNFGFTVPLVIDHENEIIAGHARYEAARQLHIEKLPCIVRDDLTDAQARAFRIADNRIAESEWNEEQLIEELELLEIEDMNLGVTGFDEFEINELQFDPDEFEPVDSDEQPNLDQPKDEDKDEEKIPDMVVCPNCGEEISLS